MTVIDICCKYKGTTPGNEPTKIAWYVFFSLGLSKVLIDTQWL